jgi:hypothetical protein
MKKINKFNVVEFIDDGYSHIVSGHRTREGAKKAAARNRIPADRKLGVTFRVISGRELNRAIGLDCEGISPSSSQL